MGSNCICDAVEVCLIHPNNIHILLWVIKKGHNLFSKNLSCLLLMQQQSSLLNIVFVNFEMLYNFACAYAFLRRSYV